MRTVVLVLLGLLVSAPAAAQDEWVTIRRAAVSGSSPVVELGSGLLASGISSAVPVRLVLTGTLTDGFDGAELDARSRFTGGRRDVIDPPLSLPAGAHVVHADEVAHRYEVEVAPGADLRFILDVGGLAARHLVTATELRRRLDGAIEIELAVPASALPASATAALVPETSPSPLWPGVLGAGFGAVALVLVSRRKRTADELLEIRAARAHAAIRKKASALGPQFEGTIPPADRLLAAVRASRGHLRAIDRALAESAFVVGASAKTRRTELQANRTAALGRMERSTSALEEALVRLGASAADRSAAADVERSLADLAAEVDVGRAVDRELGLDGGA